MQSAIDAVGFQARDRADRDRNALRLAGGFAPAYPEHGLDTPSLGVVTEAMPADITFAELAIESFYPLDRHTAVAMRALAPAGR